MTAPGHTAVVLLNLGGPDSLEAVRPFLYNLFSDRLIIRLGPSFMQRPLAWWIARKRSPISRGYYEQIGGASPLGVITKGQAAALETRLREHGDFRVYVGMRYWKPSIEDTLKEAMASGASRVLAFSLYPQYSIATTGSSEAAFYKAAGELGIKDIVAVPPWPTHPLYIDALADLLVNALEGTGRVTDPGVTDPGATDPGATDPGATGSNMPHVLFSAHSLPKSMIQDGDPYVEHIMATITELMSRFNNPWSIGYQSRSGPVEWLEPSTEEEIKRLAREGVKQVVAVPISFVSDHIETLYEVDILYKGLAQEAGMRLNRTESLNLHPVFIRALEDLVVTTIRKEGWL